ncbi:MAG: glycosyltransferase family 4 protein [Deltaproteobacteria bacterium]|nr:glycosyltransferase family 4 protein [Deltaproteobacteria bacterium]
MNKNILAISNHGFMLGGGEHSFLDLLTHLPRPWKAHAVVPEDGELKRGLAARGIDSVVIPLHPIRPWNAFQILASLMTFLRTCRKLNPDLLYCNGSRAAFYGGITGALLRLPSLWHCRIVEPDPLLDILLVRLSGRIIVNSHATAGRFKPHVIRKVRVVYNGIDLSYFKETSPDLPRPLEEGWKTILIVGRISRRKRHDVALEGFEIIARAESDAHLVCLGAMDEKEPEWWHYLLDKSRSSPFSDRIHWVGQVEDVRPWYRNAHLLILTSENESFGRVLVEAMTCGVPVVATQSGGAPEIIRNCVDGILIRPGRAEELAEAVLVLLRDNGLRNSMVRAAMERARMFSLDNHVKCMVQVFEEVSEQ